MNTDFKFLLTFLLFVCNLSFAQKISIIKNETADLLIDRKYKTNNTFSIYTNYSIQLMSTTKQVAENSYELFKKQYPNEDATIIYAQPNFKLLVGNFRNKIEAAYFLKKITKEHPNAFIVRLKK